MEDISLPLLPKAKSLHHSGPPCVRNPSNIHRPPLRRRLGSRSEDRLPRTSHCVFSPCGAAHSARHGPVPYRLHADRRHQSQGRPCWPGTSSLTDPLWRAEREKDVPCILHRRRRKRFPLSLSLCGRMVRAGTQRNVLINHGWLLINENEWRAGDNLWKLIHYFTAIIRSITS